MIFLLYCFYRINSSFITLFLLYSCMSIPVTMRALYSKLKEMIPSPVSTEDENDHLTPKMDNNEESTVFRSAALPENGVISGSACGAKSGLPTEISTSSPVNS